jgi:hypothetical protein
MVIITIVRQVFNGKIRSDLPLDSHFTGKVSGKTFVGNVHKGIIENNPNYTFDVPLDTINGVLIKDVDDLKKINFNLLDRKSIEFFRDHMTSKLTEYNQLPHGYNTVLLLDAIDTSYLYELHQRVSTLADVDYYDKHINDIRHGSIGFLNKDTGGLYITRLTSNSRDSRNRILSPSQSNEKPDKMQACYQKSLHFTDVYELLDDRIINFNDRNINFDKYINNEEDIRRFIRLSYIGMYEFGQGISNSMANAIMDSIRDVQIESIKINSSKDLGTVTEYI